MTQTSVRIEQVESEPMATIDFTYVGQHADRCIGMLPIISATASAFPDSLDALVLTAGLRGIRGNPDCAPVCPLGVAVAIWLETMSSVGSLPPRNRTGVVLAGGFSAVPDSGCDGDGSVAGSVWHAFGSRWKWVVGVAGDNDSLAPTRYVPPGSQSDEGVFLLDRRAVDVDSLRIGGIGGIFADQHDCSERAAEGRLRVLNALAAVGIDMLVLHGSPDGGSDRYPGSVPLRQLLENLPPVLVVCGHNRWDLPLITLDNGAQVLNVAGRVVVLRRHGEA